MAKNKPTGRMVRIPVDEGTRKADDLARRQRERGTSGRTGVVKDDGGKITGRDSGKGKSR